MKKLAFLVSALLLLCVLLAGCKKEPEKLRICLDVGSDFSMDTVQQTAAASALLTSLADYGKAAGMAKETIELEVIDSDDEGERSAALQRIRMEIMSGHGPDVFICLTEGIIDGSAEMGRLFPYVERAMGEGRFLPLDEYIPNFQFTSWSELLPQVMDGGKDGEGRQVVFPLRFSVPSVAYDQPVPQADSFAELSWSDVLTAEDPVLSQQLSWAWPIGTFGGDGSTHLDSHPTGLPYLYTGLVQLKDGSPVMEEEALQAAVKESLSAYQAGAATEASIPCFAVFPGLHLGNLAFLNFESPHFAFLPVRNDKGGATAVVSAYCAVNANTEQPEKAALVVDFLLSKTYQERFPKGGTPTVFDALRYTTAPSMSVNSTADWTEYLPVTESGRESWEKVCEEINAVHFPSPVDTEISKLQLEIETVMRDSYDPQARMDEFIKGSISDEQLESIIHDHFATIRKLLDEA